MANKSCVLFCIVLSLFVLGIQGEDLRLHLVDPVSNGFLGEAIATVLATKTTKPKVPTAITRFTLQNGPFYQPSGTTMTLDQFLAMPGRHIYAQDATLNRNSPASWAYLVGIKHEATPQNTFTCTRGIYYTITRSITDFNKYEFTFS